MRVGQNRKRDAGEDAIVAALRQVGVIVIPISGKDVPDLLCFHVTTGWQPIEIKAEKGELTAGQKRLQQLAPFPIIRTVDEALNFFGFFGVPI